MTGKMKHGFSFAEYAWIAAGSIITALAFNVFLVPFKIAPGGATGIATVIYHLSDKKVPVGTATLVLNIPLFIIGFKLIGHRFIIRTLFSTAALSVLLDATSRVTGSFVQTYLVNEPAAHNPDLVLYSLIGGSLMGVGIGLVFRFGATTGGTDLAARIINHFVPSLTMGQVLLIIDSAVIVFAAIIFESLRLGLYAIVTVFISTKVIDAIIEGVNFVKALLIISDKSEEISNRILNELDRGVTALKGMGMYTRQEKNVLLCVVNRTQIQMVKNIVSQTDAKAFLLLADIREVLGEGFGKFPQRV